MPPTMPIKAQSIQAGKNAPKSSNDGDAEQPLNPMAARNTDARVN
jgi:hypothetical protein